MSLPWRASAFTSASTTKAFSVPRLAARAADLWHGRSAFGLDVTSTCVSCRPHADQLRRLPGRPQARRHRQARDPQLPRAAGLLRLGGAASDATEAELERDAARSSTCTRSRSRTPATATSGRRSRSTATRCSWSCTPSRSVGDELQRRRGRHLRRPQLRALGAPAAPSAASRRCARAPSASPSCCATARATCSTRSWTRWSTATSRCSTRSRRELETIEEQLFGGRPRRARTSRRSTTSSRS